MSQVWINFADYSTTGLVFNGVGCLFWVIAYGVLVVKIRKKKFVEMPAYVAGANIGWEFIWSFFFIPDTGLLYALSYKGAFLLDCFIFYSVLKFGTKQPMMSIVKKNFVWLSIVNFIFWIVFSYLYRDEGYDTTIGANSGYIINVILSLLCLSMLLQSEDTSNFSRLLAWTRSLGTGFITVSIFIFYPSNHFVQLLGVSCLIIDSVYIYLLIKRRKMAKIPEIA
jgi:hypothetical protein